MDINIQSDLIKSFELQNRGHLKEAEAGYRKLLFSDPNNIHALNLLAVICLNSGRAEECKTLILKALDIDASDAEPHANLGLALRALNRFDEAEVSFRKSLQLNPKNYLALKSLGSLLAEMFRTDEAIRYLRAALQINETGVDALVNLSAALLTNEKTQGALSAAARAVEIDNGQSISHVALGNVLVKMARYEAAADCFQLALSLDRSSIEARIGLSNAVKEVGDSARAEMLLREVISFQENNALAYNSLGVLLEQKGDAAAAAAAFRSAIAANPRFANAYYQLAQLKGSKITVIETNSILALHDEVDLHDELRTPLAFALACIYERAGDFNLSFKYLLEGQSLKAKTHPYDDSKVTDFHRRIVCAMPLGWPPIEQKTTVQGPQPVFVLGMPRSGTSLTEQILSSHPEIGGAGEVSFIEDTIAEAVQMAGHPFPECVSQLLPLQFETLGQYYLKRLLGRVSAERYVVDKTPMNFQYIGFIAAILPNARIVHCRRDSMDNCLSIFKLPFETTHTYSHDLHALGSYYRHYTKLVEHWESVVGDRMISLQYEELVADLPTQATRLIRFLEVEPDERMLDFHKTERLVKTPSASQVRQPIYSDSIQAWRRYGEALRPLALALDQHPIQPQ